MDSRHTDLSAHRHCKALVVIIVAVFIIAVLFTGMTTGSDSVSASTHNEKYFICIDISENDTLWSIAGQYMTEEYSSLDDYISEIRNINGLTGDKIYSGATLVVPYYAAPQ